MTVHPGMRFSVDPWDPSYGVSLDVAEGQSRQEVDPGVELATDQWAPIDPPADGSAPAATLFVDGVRRVDAQVWVDDGAAALPGAVRVVRSGGDLLLPLATARTSPRPRSGAGSSRRPSTPSTS